MGFSLTRMLVAEALGTGLLLVAVVGSGVMAEQLAGGNVALALLANTIATGAALLVLILAFAPISGAHFNPCVTLIMAVRRSMPPAHAAAYVVVQVGSALAGVWLAHAMFDLPILEVGDKVRSGFGQGLSEGVATFGLITAIVLVARSQPAAVPYAVAAWITAAYWCTASTSFANPAVTIARACTTTFAGIRVGDVPLFVLAQIVGALAAHAVCAWLVITGPEPERDSP